jgi:hypothetical protein
MTAETDRYVYDESVSVRGRAELWHLDGVGWYNAPLPRKRHKCWTQTRGWMDEFTLVERCACGAMQIDLGGWGCVNERRKDLAAQLRGTAT